MTTLIQLVVYEDLGFVVFDQITGIFNCFSCGFKGKLILSQYENKANQLQLRRENLKKKIRQKMAEGAGLLCLQGI